MLLDQVRTLQARFDQHGLSELGHAPVDEPTGQPDTFAEILRRMDELPRLRFTGDPKVTQALDDHSVGNWVEVAWDALCALNEYAAASAAGTAGGDFRHWCLRQPEDREHRFSAGKVKMKESEGVGNRGKWRGERTFPVPVSVDPSGRLFMQAHLCVGGGNTVAPRLYFHDDGPGTGLVYVGYIGPHPSNTLT
ncbi:hypothetical protein [Streptomyces sp. B6B3]|uniref:hypothetical protein n=1 Tax=Streptomyces sp. B6B3 TaxID=3153570 RepID=UPI00325CE7DA